MLSSSLASTVPAGSCTVPLLQSAADANIRFVNIDWKRSRHNTEESAQRNLTTLTDTTPRTATERATSSSQMDPNESHGGPWHFRTSETDDDALGPPTGLPMSTSKQHASASGDGLGDTDLEKIVALLMWMSQAFHPKIHVDSIHHATLEALIKCAESPTAGTPGVLHTASVSKLSKLIDIMVLYKDGSPKDPNEILQFMKRCVGIREELLASASDNATGCV